VFVVIEAVQMLTPTGSDNVIKIQCLAICILQLESPWQGRGFKAKARIKDSNCALMKNSQGPLSLV